MSHYLKPVGHNIILCCDFDVKKLPVNLPVFYRECFECFTQCSAVERKSEIELSPEEISHTIIWNNKFICIDGKSIFNSRLNSKGLIRIGDLVTESNQFISNSNLWQWDFSPKDVFNLMAIIDAIPVPWRRSLKMNGCVNKRPFILPDEIQLVLSNRDVSIYKAMSKSIYVELISVLVTSPTAQWRYNKSLTLCL